jgi:hypothetical protein
MMSGTAKESTSRRGVLSLLALAGLAIAVYLSLYQLGVISTPWDPFFGRRVDRVLDLTAPVPDALAGVMAYATELLLLAIGRTRLWARVALGGVLVSGVGVSIVLIVIQPTLVGDWCTLCLCSAGLSGALFALGIGDTRAALVSMGRPREHGQPMATLSRQ